MKSIGQKVGSKYGLGEMNDIISKSLNWGFDFFELSGTDLKDYKFYSDLRKRGIKFGYHIPHAFTPENQVCLAATKSPYKEKAEKWFKKAIKDVKKINSEYIIAHPDLYKIPKGNSRYPNGVDFANSREEGWERLIEVLSSYQGEIPLLVEVMPAKEYYLHDLDETKKLIQEIPNIKFCFDIEHATQAVDDIDKVIEWYQAIADKVLVLHLCDWNPKIRGHLPIGQGIISFKKFLDSVQLYNYQRPILEVMPASEKNRKKDLVSSREKIESLI
jgi:sugar phosphate isomerase/epimerase